MQGALTAKGLGGRIGLVLTGACLALAAAAPTAGAQMAEGGDQWRGQSETQVTCTKDSGEGPVAISAVGGNGADLRFVRSGDELVIFEENYLHGIVPCGPGSLALDEITEVTLVEDNVVYDSSFTIDLTQGPLGPGAGADDGTPEIEFDLPIGASFNSARFEGAGALPESINIGRSGNDAAADLNGDGDADVTWEGAESAVVDGTPGADRIDLSGKHPGLGASYRPYSLAVDGAGGDDEVVLGGGDVYDRYIGGAGDDTFRLSGASEALIDGGDGVDTLILDPGYDPDAVGSLQSIEKVVKTGEGRQTPAPAVRIVGSRVPRSLAGLRRHGVRIRVLCSQDCRARVQISTGRRAVRQGLPWVLRTRFVELRAGKPRWVTLHLRPVAGRAVADNRPGHFRIRNWVRATFSGGTVRGDWAVSQVG